MPIPEILPPEAVISQIGNITNTSAQIRHEIEDAGGGTISSVGLCWSTSPNPDLSDNVLEIPYAGSKYITEIENLQGDQEYYIRSFAKNESGLAFSPEETFTTQQNPECRLLNIKWPNGQTEHFFYDNNILDRYVVTSSFYINNKFIYTDNLVEQYENYGKSNKWVRFRYYYRNDTLIRIVKNYYAASSVVSDVSYAEDRITIQIGRYWNADLTYWDSINFFLDQNKNIYKGNNYYWGELDQEFTATFGNSPNPFKENPSLLEYPGMMHLYFQYFTNNNPLSYSSNFLNDIYEYEVDPKTNLITKQTNTDTGIKVEFEYEYCD